MYEKKFIFILLTIIFPVVYAQSELDSQEIEVNLQGSIELEFQTPQSRVDYFTADLRIFPKDSYREDVLEFKKNSGLNIVGVGYTVYIGSEYENMMLAEAGRLVTWAHQNGMITVLWMYPRGKAVLDEKDPHLVAGAAGVALCLGSDFAKVNYPKKTGHDEKQRAESFKEAIII